MAQPTPTRIQKASFADSYDRRIVGRWMQGYGEPTHEFEDYYNVESINEQDKRWSCISGLGTWVLKPIGENITYDGIFQGYDTTITPATYASGFTLEYETWKDDLSGIIGSQTADSLAQMGRETVEILMAQPFNAGIASVAATTAFAPWMSGGDSKYMLATDHPVLSGGTWANTPSSQCDLSVTSLQAAKVRGMKMVGARGQQYQLKYDTLVVPIDGEQTAREILGSPTLPYLNTQTPNTLHNGMTIKVWSRLTDTDSWFVNAGKSSKIGGKGIDTVAIWREKPWFDRDNVFDNGDRRYKGQFRLGAGCINSGNGWDGSTG